MIKDIREDLKDRLTQLAQQDLAQQIFDRVTKACFLNLVEEENNMKIIDQIIAQVPEQESQVIQVFNMLFLFTTEVLRINMVESEVQYSLQEQGWSQQQVDSYVIQKKKLNFQLNRDFIDDPENAIIQSRYQSRINFKQLIDIDWKQEILVTSKYANKVFQEIYNLQLHLKDAKGGTSLVAFKCTLPQLIEINNKLDVIVKNIENGSNLSQLKIVD